ncbi:hypothetical protein [Roseinatronobacter sp. S2]|uniref:hypothetical protein n=1 Tax=Roseinatronobacter sp. S2 TaxID=3035471 RepID=UPI0024107492|nr:hypothetical protein [Roseinatronobacter sp. S2]WFE75205.1 hypothetical protein P8S53_02010 [Roseinatronobacter sp. S2]
MIAYAAATTLLRLSDAAAVLMLAALASALLLPDPYAAIPDHLRPGAWRKDTISVPAALALLAVNARLRQGWAKGWLIWAGLVGYLICAYGLYSFDRVMNPAYPLYLAVLATSIMAVVLFMRVIDLSALRVGPRPRPCRAMAVLGNSVFWGTSYSWPFWRGLDAAGAP